MAKDCTHKTIDDHSVGVTHKHTLWICSVCKRQFRWEEGVSSYFGNMECLKCGTASIDAVCCSPACQGIKESEDRTKPKAKRKGKEPRMKSDETEKEKSTKSSPVISDHQQASSPSDPAEADLKQQSTPSLSSPVERKFTWRYLLTDKKQISDPFVVHGDTSPYDHCIDMIRGIGVHSIEQGELVDSEGQVLMYYQPAQGWYFPKDLKDEKDTSNQRQGSPSR